MDFQFFAPTRIVVGQGRVDALMEVIPNQAKKAVLITGNSAKNSGLASRIGSNLQNAGMDYYEYSKPPGEPDVAMTDYAAEAAREARCDFAISAGGGSVIDLAKAVCGLAPNEGSVEDYLEGVGRGWQLQHLALPHIALPTTAGAGAEVTRNAVIRSPDKRYKKSFRHPALYPIGAILDAQWCVGLSPQQSAYSGMDALTQLIEAYISCRATPMTDALALQGIKLVFHSIRGVVNQGDDVGHRTNMLLASTLSGICLANAGLGLAHGFAAGLGALYDVPHGKVCAILLPHAIRYNLQADDPASKRVEEKLAQVGRLLIGGNNVSGKEAIQCFVREIETLNHEFGIPKDLKEFSIPKTEEDLLIKMSMGNSMRGNPIEITPETAKEILSELL